MGGTIQRTGKGGFGDPAREIAWAGACALAGVAFTLFLYALNRRAFFSDDTQQAFAPLFMAIGHTLAHGHWPALTLQMLNGGALADEYQYALYNPVCLLADLAVSGFHDQARAEAVIAGLHYAILGSGAYAFTRSCGAGRPLSALAAITFVTNNFIYYWLAESWIMGLISLAWMTWALAGLIRAHESRLAFAVAMVATALTVASGCYHVVAMLALGVAVIGIVRWRADGARLMVAPIAASALGCLLAIVSILPLPAMRQIAVRSGGLNNDGRLTVDLYGVISPSSPFHLGHYENWVGFGPIGAPIFFAGWYLLPLAALIDWKKLGKPSTPLMSLIAMAGVFVIATQGPEQVLGVRFPIWYLAPLHLCLLATFSVIATKAGFAPPTRLRAWAVILIAYFGWLGSVQVLPEARATALISAMAICALAALGALLQKRNSNGYVMAGLLGTALFAGFTHFLIRTNPDQPDRGATTAAAAVVDLDAIPTTASIFLGSIDEALIGKAPEIRTGAMALANGGANPYGYSPFGHLKFSYRFLVQLWGTPLEEGAGRLFQPSQFGGAPWADLLRVDQVVIPRVGARPAAVAAQAGPGWRVAAVRPYTVTLARIAPPLRGPGSVAWTSPGLVVAAKGAASSGREILTITARAGRDDTIVFDRLGWPGYRASFNGHPLALNLIAAPLLMVKLPDGAAGGDLELSYAPAGATLGLFAAVAALGMLVAILVGWRRLAALGLTADRAIEA